MHAVPNRAMIWRVSLARIEEVVSAHLGPVRVPGNAAGPCFSRQVSMYLAKHVATGAFRKSASFIMAATTQRFSTLSNIENLRKMDNGVEALIEVLINELAAAPHEAAPRVPMSTSTAFIDAVAS